MFKNAFILSVIALAFAAGNPQHAYASIFQNISDLEDSVGFGATSPFDAVGLLVGTDANGDSFVAGSGVLIDANYVLTAGHVLFDEPNLQWESLRFFNNPDVLGGDLNDFIEIDLTVPFPGFTGSEAGGGTGNDIGLARLSSPINNVAAATLFDGPDNGLVGAEFITAGYGNPGVFGNVGAFDGIRRGGRNTIDSAGASFGVSTVEEQFFVADLDLSSSDNPLPLEWAGSQNDSGSPWFVDVNGEYQIVGITNGGLVGNTQTFGIRTALYNDFINETIQANSVPEPGAMGLLTLGLMGIAMRRRKGESHA